MNTDEKERIVAVNRCVKGEKITRHLQKPESNIGLAFQMG